MIVKIYLNGEFIEVPLKFRKFLNYQQTLVFLISQIFIFSDSQILFIDFIELNHLDFAVFL